MSKLADSTLTLTGDNTYTGITIISEGILEIGSSGITGSILGDINNTASLIFNRSNNLTYSGIISGTGTMSKLTAGTLTLTGDNTYTGTTIISEGILEIGNLGITGSILGDINNTTSLIFNRSNDLTYSGDISGIGTITQSGLGTLTLSGLNTYSGTTTINSGTISISNDNNLGVGALTLNNGTLKTTGVFSSDRAITLNVGNGGFYTDINTTLTQDGLVSGSGRLTKLGSGTLILTAGNSYNGGTTITSGILQIGNTMITGSVIGDITNNAGLVFNRSDNVTYSGIISGSGNVTQAGTGNLILSGINNYNGLTTINSGTISIGSNANLGTGGVVLDNGMLKTTATFSSSRSVTLNPGGGIFSTDPGTTFTQDGLVSGSGQLTKTGSGTMSLTNPLNDFTGSALVLDGVLKTYSNIIPGNIQVNSGDFIDFEQDVNGTYTGIISGAGNLEKDGNGILTLTAIQMYTGQTDINQGSLQVTTAVIDDNNVNVASNTALIFNQNTDGSYSGILNGNGMLVKLGTGTVTLNSANTFLGGSFINAGALSLSQDNNLGDVSASLTMNGGDVQNTGTFSMNRLTVLGVNGGGFITDSGTILTQNSKITGVGQLKKFGDGTLTLNNILNDYNGGTNITAGTIAISNDGNLGTGDLILDNGSIQITTGFSSNRGITLNIEGVVLTDMNTTLTQDGLITGPGQLIKKGAGALILTGTNNYAGGTTISDGTLQIGSGGNTGVISGDILNNANLIFNRSDNFSYTGIISGAGSVKQVGLGNLTLSGNNTYNNGTSIISGTVSISNDSNLGNGALVLDNGILKTTANFSSTHPITINLGGGNFLTDVNTNFIQDGLITGPGELIKTGLGTMTLTNPSNNISGGILIIEGELKANSQTLPDTIQVNAGAFLTFQENISGLYSGVISGTGNVHKNGNGILTLMATQLYSGQTDVYQGSLQVTTDSINNNNINLSLNTNLIFNQNTDGNYSGLLMGNGTLNKLGSGIVTLNNLANNFTGGTIITSGALSIGQDNYLGNALGSIILNNGTLQSTATFSMNRTTTLGLNGGTFLNNALSTLTQNGQITGVGELRKSGLGTLILNNSTNNYTGGLLLNQGILQSGSPGSLVNNNTYTINGGTLDLNSHHLTMSHLSGTGGLIDLNSANLIIDQSANSQFSGAFKGDNTVTITKLNMGDLSLTGDSSAYVGNFIVNSGELILDGILGGTLIINKDACLDGTGTAYNVIIDGSICPGNSIGTINILGNYVQNIGAIYDFEINPLGQSDLINITGQANIQGGTVNVIKAEGIYKPGTHYTILSASGGFLAGKQTYNNIVQQALPYLDFVLNYDAHNIYLDIRNNNVDFSLLGLTANEIATANSLESIDPNSTLYLSALNLNGEESAREAFNSLSGEMHASLLGSISENNHYVKGIIINQLNYGSNNTSSYHKNPNRNSIFYQLPSGSRYPVKNNIDYNIWFQAYNSWGESKGDSNAAKMSDHCQGLLIGVDTAIKDLWRIGLMTGIGRSNYDIIPRKSQAESNNSYFGLYGSREGEKLGFRIGTTLAWHELDTNRIVILPGIHDIQNATYMMRSKQLFTELGYKILNNYHHIEPIAQVVHLSSQTDSFKEKGNIATSLNGEKSKNNIFYSTLGVRGSSLISKNKQHEFHIHGLFGWSHNFNQNTPKTVVSFDQGDSFITGGSPISPNAAMIEAGIEITLYNQNLNLKLDYNSQIRRNFKNNSIQGRLSYQY